MPLYKFVCEQCKAPKAMIAPTPAQALIKVGRMCSKCPDKRMLLLPQVPGDPQVMEKLDDGVRYKAVERLQDAEKLYKDRDLADAKKRLGEEE